MKSCEKTYKREVIQKSPLAPTFFVGFAFHETYEDLVTAQKMICYKRSPQGSNHSMTPKSSASNVQADNNAQNSYVSDILESLVTDIGNDANDREEVDDTEKEVSKITDYFVVNKREIEPKQLRDIHRNSSADKEMRPRKTRKEKRYKYIDKLKKNVFNKSKEEKSLNKKLEQYFQGKTVNLNELSDKINSEIISQMVSRSKVLKKVSAKESLFEYEESKKDDEKSNDASDSASFVTANESFFSYSSQDTLTNKDSRTLPQTGDVSQSDSVESVVQVTLDNLFQTSAINVSTAVVNTEPFATEHFTPVSSQEDSDVKIDLTSTEGINFDNTLTSEPLSRVSSKIISDINSHSMLNTSETTLSLETLTGATRTSTTEVSDDDYDALFIAKSSSYFEIVDYGTSSLIAVAEESVDTSTTPESVTADVFSGKTLLLDTVMKLGLFPEMSRNKLEYPFDLIISDKFIQSNPNAKEIQRIGDDSDDQSNNSKTVPMSITQKLFCHDQNQELKKMIINLPCEADIKELLKENEKPLKKKISDDFVSSNPNPSCLSELWEQMLIALDSTARTIEDRLGDKIINEMKKCMSILEVQKPSLEAQPDRPLQIDVSSEFKRCLSNKGINVDEVLSGPHQGQQCCLVQNETIDKLLLKMESRGEPLCLPGVSFHKESKFSNSEHIKQPEVADPEEKELSITISTETVRPSVQKLRMCHRLKASDTWFFLRENVFVLTSVPVFFSVFIIIYLVIIFIINPF